MMISADAAKETVLEQAKGVLGDRINGTVIKEIYVPGKIVNIVVKPN